MDLHLLRGFAPPAFSRMMSRHLSQDAAGGDEHCLVPGLIPQLPPRALLSPKAARRGAPHLFWSRSRPSGDRFSLSGTEGVDGVLPLKIVVPNVGFR